MVKMSSQVTTLKERLVPRHQGTYVEAEFSGQNTSGGMALGKRVLLKMDEAAIGKTVERDDGTVGRLDLPPTTIERMNLASESGVLVEAGPEAFSRHADGTIWTSYKPQPGDRVVCEKYAGIVIIGDDGRSYRLMEDSCIGMLLRKRGDPAYFANHTMGPDGVCARCGKTAQQIRFDDGGADCDPERRRV